MFSGSVILFCFIPVSPATVIAVLNQVQYFRSLFKPCQSLKDSG